jgi:hypothetical protein
MVHLLESAIALDARTAKIAMRRDTARHAELLEAV